jgi:hypothetical protein
MRECHYLRIADQPVHQAVLTLYHDDPSCDRQQQALLVDSRSGSVGRDPLAHERDRPTRRARATDRTQRLTLRPHAVRAWQLQRAALVSIRGS